MQLIIETSGNVRSLYDEAIDVRTLGAADVTRASHVELADNNHWMADLSPVGGPMLGPFQLRSDALRAEQAWLESNWLV